MEQSSNGSRVSSRLAYLWPLISPFVSDFTQCYLSTPESDDHNLLTTTLPTNVTTPLLREWAKATLASRSWRNALVTAVDVSISYCRLSLVV